MTTNGNGASANGGANTNMQAIIEQLEDSLTAKAEERKTAQLKVREVERTANQMIRDAEKGVTTVEEEIENLRTAIKALGGRPRHGTASGGSWRTERDQIKKRAIEVLKAHPDKAMKESDLRDEVAVGYSALASATQELVDEGAITREPGWGKPSEGQESGRYNLVTLVDPEKAGSSVEKPPREGVVAARHKILNDVRLGEFITASAFAERAGMKPETVRKAADALVKKGKMSKTPDPEDPKGQRVVFERVS